MTKKILMSLAATALVPVFAAAQTFEESGARLMLLAQAEGHEIADRHPLPPTPAPWAENALAKIELTEVNAWYDRMPSAGRPRKPGIMVGKVSFTNKTAADLEITLNEARVSYDSSSWGAVVAGVGFEKDGSAAVVVKVKVPAGKTLVASFRGEGVLEEGHARQDAYVMLQFRAGGQTLLVRKGAKIDVVY